MAAGDARRASWPDALVGFAIRRPGQVMLAWLLLGLAAIPGIAALRVDTSTGSVLDRRDPAWTVYQHGQDLFGADEIIAVVLRSERPYDPELLARIPALGEALAALEGVRRVDSIATVSVVRVTPEGDLELKPPLEDAPVAPEALARHVEERLRTDRIAPRNWVSADGRAFALNVLLERDVEALHAPLLEQIHAIADPQGAILSGVPVFRVAANERTGSEILFFAPLTAFVIAAFLIVVFRRIEAVAIAVAPGLIGSWLMTACMGAFGSPLSITTMVLPSIILALGCAYAMHLLGAAGGVDGADRLRAALEPIALPVALSGLTTAVGLVSIAVIRIDAVRFTGSYGALGVFFVTLSALTLVPAALQLRPLPAIAPRGFDWIQTRLSVRLVDFIGAHRRAILLAWLVLGLLMAAQLTRVTVETDATRWLPIGNPVRDDYEEIGRLLSGISPVNVLVESEGEGRVTEPETLRAIDALARHLGDLPEVGKALSIADPLRQLHGGFIDDPTQPLPQDRDLTEQYLLLLESMDELEDLVTDDRRAANVALRVDDNGSLQLLAVAEQARQWWAEHGVAGWTVRPTGIMYEFARAQDEIAFGQLRGLSIALAIISVLLLVILRWPLLALVSLAPNALPLVVIFGAMGLLGMPLDAGTVMTGGLALGIAVDDTIHLATGFHARSRSGADSRTALRDAFAHVLPAICATTVMITLAFAVLGLSEFTITRNLGLLTGGIMVLCLLADVTLLGCLLLGLPPRPRAAAEEGAPRPQDAREAG